MARRPVIKVRDLIGKYTIDNVVRIPRKRGTKTIVDITCECGTVTKGIVATSLKHRTGTCCAPAVYNSTCVVCGCKFDGSAPNAKFCRSESCQDERKKRIRDINIIAKAKWRKTHPDHDANYFTKNKVVLSAKHKEYVLKNIETIKLKRKEWRGKTKDKKREKDVIRYQKARDRLLESSRERRLNDTIGSKMRDCVYHQIGRSKGISLTERKAIFLSVKFKSRTRVDVQLVREVLEYE